MVILDNNNKFQMKKITTNKLMKSWWSAEHLAFALFC